MEQPFLNFPCLVAFCVRGTLDPGSNYRGNVVGGGREEGREGGKEENE